MDTPDKILRDSWRANFLMTILLLLVVLMGVWPVMAMMKKEKEADKKHADLSLYYSLLAEGKSVEEALCFIRPEMEICAYRALPIADKVEEVEVIRTGDIRTGEFPICETLGHAMKMATILADEGEEKAGEFQQDPATPCGTTVMGTPWKVGNVLYVLQGKDQQWVRVIELHSPPSIGITRFWVTRVDVQKQLVPTGRRTHI